MRGRTSSSRRGGGADMSADEMWEGGRWGKGVLDEMGERGSSDQGLGCE